MVAGANVASVEAIEELRTALTRFGAEARSSLEQMELQIRRAREWLAELVAERKRAVERCTAFVLRARAALRSCMASGDRDNPPNCRMEEDELRTATRQLEVARAELQIALRWRAAFEERAIAYQQQAQRLAQRIEQDIPKGKASLGRTIASLDAYIAVNAPGGAAPIFGTASSSAEVTIGRALVGGTALAGLGLAATAVAIVGALKRRQGLARTDTPSQSATPDHWSDFHDVPTERCPSGFSRATVSTSGSTVVIESDYDRGNGTLSTEQIALAVGALGSSATLVILVNPQNGTHATYLHDPVSGHWVVDQREPTMDILSLPGSAVEAFPNGVRHVRLDQIDLTDSRIQREEDFEDGHYARTLDALLTLQHTVLPAVERGVDADYFSESLSEKGVDW